MSQLGLILHESLCPQREARTLLGLLTEQMDGADSSTIRRRSLKERFRFTGIGGCCGTTWVFCPIIRHEHHQQQQRRQQEEARGEGEANVEQQELQVQDPNPDPSSSSGMNLAAALAAERHMRGSEETGGGERATPWRVSLMKLLEETKVETKAMGNKNSFMDFLYRRALAPGSNAGPTPQFRTLPPV
ncbi:unnamed protein product [Vicia faba]|uniref:Uncharacterized protein n=1 Tax=Vicia faba TaxID=3906 RepID=A0AAV0ZKF7_VICFA|nr:unnamed protein product [Vicia faba]